MREYFKNIITYSSIIGLIVTVIFWHYDSKLELQEERHKQEITSMKSIFADSKQVFLINDIVSNDSSNIKETKGDYFENSNIYALKKLNGFDYIESEEGNLYNLFDKCNQKSFWRNVFYDNPIIEIKLTEKEQKINDELIVYLKKKIFSKTKPIINYWIERDNDFKTKSCIIEFKATEESIKKALKNTVDFFMNPIFLIDNKEILENIQKTKQELEKNDFNSQEIFNQFKNIFFNFIRSASPKKTKIIIEKEKLFFMDYFLPNNHVILLGFLNNNDINFVILLNSYKGFFPDKETENRFKYWLSQYRIIPSEKND
jgi:hypothetical protein